MLLKKLIRDLPVYPVIDPINPVRFSMSEQPIPLKLLCALDISDFPIRIKLPGDQILLSGRFFDDDKSLLPLRRAFQTGKALRLAASSDWANDERLDGQYFVAKLAAPKLNGVVSKSNNGV